VYPAAHYHLGGVETDTHGRSSVPWLYAAGECACTGVHGANRMAGNSLAEAVVFGRRAAKSIAEDIDGGSINQMFSSDLAPGLSDRSAPNGKTLERVREIMSASVGVLRSEEGLSDAISQLASLDDGPHVTAAQLICESALARRESRGVHFRSDYPERTSDFDGVSLQVAGRNRVLSRRIRN